MYVVGVDPANRNTGICIISMEMEPVIVGSFQFGEFLDEEALEVLDECVPSPWCVAIERPFNRRGPGAADSRLRKLFTVLARRRATGRFLKPCLMRVYPSQWRAVLGVPTKPRALAKRGAITKAHELCEVLNDDEADAVCIAWWGVLQNPTKWVP